MKYRKKPVVIEAFLFDNQESGYQIVDQMGSDLHMQRNNNEELVMKIKTLEGLMTAHLGDYIIKGVKGELYSCKPDIFEMTYEEVIE